jgi:hypothetical protein
MRNTLPRFWNAALLCAALLVPIALAPTALFADDRSYHDKKNNDDHRWNAQEDRAHRIWEKQNHKRHTDFSRRNENDQQAYWAWRHEHSDALLKIDIR